MEKVRVLRILEYVGDRKWVEDTLKRSAVPLNGTSANYTGNNNIIKSSTLDHFPEVLNGVGEVTITKEEYERLLERDNWLSCLEAAGVDNWQGYSDAMKMMEEEE